MICPVLDSNNAYITVTKFNGSTVAALQTFDGIPLGSVGASATGELAAKVIVIGGTGTTGSIPAGTAAIGGTKDNGPQWTPIRANISSADASSAADLTVAPTTGQKIIIDDLWVSAAAAMRVDILEETSGTVLWAVYLPANGSVQFTPRDGLKFDTVNKKARIQASAAGAIRVTCLYHSEA